MTKLGRYWAAPGEGVGGIQETVEVLNHLLCVQFLFLADVLQWRAHTTPDHPLFLLLNAKVSAGLWGTLQFVISKSS